jgi:putative ABC transport system permease protein
VLLEPGTNAKALEDKLDDWAKTYINISEDLYRHLKDKNYGFRLQPLTDIHLKSHLRWELEPNGYMSYIYMMTAAALLILVIACVNFINLTTAQSANRSKEIGIRKSLGALRGQVAAQFTGESVLVSMMAVVLAIVIVETAAPFFRQITGAALKIDYTFLGLTVLGMSLWIGFIAGIFPSAYLASVKPSIILRGKFLQNPAGSRFRQGFTVLQFFASMILITTSIVIYNQLEFIQESALGFDEDKVVVIPIKNPELINQRFNELRNELLRIPHITSVSAASNIPGKHFNQNPIFATANPQLRIASSEVLVDHDFFSVLNIDIVDGRPFSKDNVADRKTFILNETGAKNLYQGNAVGQELSWDFGEGLIKGTVIGVVKDFHFQSLHEPVRPLLFRLSPHYNYVVIKLNTNNFSRTAISIENTWKKFDNRFAFDFAFLSSYLNQQYRQEQSMAAVLGTFSCIAIIIACFGLLAIAALTFRQKTKEVSIRKIMGATVVQIMLLLAKDFTRLVLAAIILAVPISWWIMRSWLDNFTFRTAINPLIFVGAGLLLLAIAWLTLSYLVWSVSRINPVETLKND